MRRALLVGLVIGLAASAQESSRDETAVRGVVKKYVDAREARNAEAVRALFTKDADQLVSSGEWRRGQDALVKGTMASSQQNSGTRTITVETVRFLAPGIALVDGRYEIAGESGTPTRKMWSTFVMTKEGGDWRIAAIRNMLPAGGR